MDKTLDLILILYTAPALIVIQMLVLMRVLGAFPQRSKLALAQPSETTGKQPELKESWLLNMVLSGGIGLRIRELENELIREKQLRVKYMNRLLLDNEALAQKQEQQKLGSKLSAPVSGNRDTSKTQYKPTSKTSKEIQTKKR